MPSSEWIEPFYTQKSAWFGPSGIRDHHRARAATIQRLCGPAPQRVLELGAGAGGSAAATADLGYTVVAIELSTLRAQFARDLAAQSRQGQLTIVEGDFYTAIFDKPFDIVTYWNGFGVGTDHDQQRLLHRIATEWLTPAGCALIDISNPWPWARAAGQTERYAESHLMQRNDFDPLHCRFLDEWWPEGQEACKITQSIRCYTPADIQLLLAPTPFIVSRMEINGTAFDLTPDATIQHPLWEAWDYLIQITRNR